MSVLTSTHIPWTPLADGSWPVQRTKTVMYRAKELNVDRSEKQILSLTLRGVVENDPDNPEGLVPADYATYQVFEKGDLVFKLIDLENLRTSRVGWVHRRGIMSSAYLRLRPRSGIDVRYFYWQFFDLYGRHVFNELGSGVRSTLGAEDVLELPLLIPPYDAQRAIADYLDTETARIDVLIEKKQRMVELLLEADRAKRDLWVADLFSTWGVTSLRRRLDRIEQGWSPQCDAVEADPGGWGVLKTSAVSSGEFLPSENKRLPVDIKPDLRWELHDGDLLVIRGSGSASKVGVAAVVRTHGRRLMMSDLTYRLILSGMNSDFVAAVMQSRIVRGELESQIRNDVGQTLKVRVDDLKNLSMPATPLVEQEKALSMLASHSAGVTALTIGLRRQIELLAGRRKALITTAVTGELKIEGAVA